MIPDTHSEFGHYVPNAFFRSLIALSQNAPPHWLGQQLAQIVRKLVLWTARLPIDVAVGPIKMRCYLRDNNSEKKFVFMPWRFDQRERQLLVQALPPDGVFVDIGANVGIYTLTAATHMGPLGRIVALEPNPPAHERLCFNIEATRSGRAQWPKIDALQVGVADASGVLELHLDPNNLGGSSIAPQDTRLFSGSHSAQGERVVRIPCKSLLAILEEQAVSKIDVLKIDIEGAEDIALLPFIAEAPDKTLPRFMIIENSEHLWKQDLVGALANRGYTVQMRSRMNTVYQRPPAGAPAQADHAR
jgi:FkbM family methyltransferase